MSIILQVFWTNLILFIWFETDAFLEYTKLFKLSKFFKVDSFEIYRKENNPKITYHSYIRQKHTSFITKLFTCVPCLNAWIVLITSVIFNNLLFYPVVYLVSYVMYKILKKYIYA
jgi:hypothetical protein